MNVVGYKKHPWNKLAVEDMLNRLEKVTIYQLITVMWSYHYLYLFFKSILSKTFIIFLPILTHDLLQDSSHILYFLITHRA